MAGIPTPRKPACYRHPVIVASCPDCTDVLRYEVAAARAFLAAAARPTEGNRSC